MMRGCSEAEARTMVVKTDLQTCLVRAPTEYAVEMNNLIKS